MFFAIEKRLTPLDTLSDCPGPALAVLTEKQYKEGVFGDEVRGMPMPRDADVCRLYQREQGLVGTFYLPAHGKRAKAHAFSCALRENRVLFLDDSSFVADRVQRIRNERVFETAGCGRFLYTFLDGLTSEDFAELDGMEKSIMRLEDAILAGVERDVDGRMRSFRRELLSFSRYALQLAEVGEALMADIPGYFDEEERELFRLFCSRVERMGQQVVLLREYVNQVRDEQADMVAGRQNKIMTTLTVVTSVFLPLTLITGWYGMNFTHMPELRAQWAYPAVFLLSIAVAVGCLAFFRRKKYW